MQQQARFAVGGLAVPDRFADRNRLADQAQRIKTVGNGLLRADHFEIHHPRAMAAAGQRQRERCAVNPQLRRQQYQGAGPAAAGTLLTAGPISVDRESGRAYKDGRELSLTGREFLLLACLVEHADKIISKERLYEQVWGAYSAICDNTIMVHIRHLREKIEDSPSSPRQLVTVKGLGYKLKKRTG